MMQHFPREGKVLMVPEKINFYIWHRKAFMVRLSVVIITFNEERNLARCLESVREVADEILVVDSSSSDNTVVIAAGYGARVIQHAFDGYGEQKNFATGQAANDWILSLDADEVLTPELIASIRQVKQGPKYDVYRMPRLTNYCGQWIKHCGWYPDKQTRFYNRTKGAWQELRVHEYWKPTDEQAQYGLLAGDLLHYSFASVSEHVKKIEKYTELAALAAVERGKRVSLLKIWLSPWWHFVSEYYFRLGFLDGFYGYTICKLSAYAAFLKCTKIRLYSRK
jgi:glycosyltransferase involved in cell wall biosynthesis